MEQSKKYNANVTFNTNYDEAYKNSPVFDRLLLNAALMLEYGETVTRAGKIFIHHGYGKVYEKMGAGKDRIYHGAV